MLLTLINRHTRAVMIESSCWPAGSHAAVCSATLLACGWSCCRLFCHVAGLRVVMLPSVLPRCWPAESCCRLFCHVAGQRSHVAVCSATLLASGVMLTSVLPCCWPAESCCRLFCHVAGQRSHVTTLAQSQAVCCSSPGTLCHVV